MNHLNTLDPLVDSIELLGLQVVIVVQLDPGAFRPLHDFLQSTTERQGRLEVVNMAVMCEGATADEFNASSHLQPLAPTAAAARRGLLQTPTAAPAPAVVEPAGRSKKIADDVLGSGSAKPSSSGRAGEVLYAQGPIAGIPEEFASRKERFMELDQLQPGWEVELKSKGETVDAVFFAPNGQKVGAFANARRAALAAHKQLLGL